MKTSLYAPTLLAIASLVMVNAASADQNTPKGYVVSSNKALVMSKYGECWKTGSWTVDMAIAECDPSLVKVAVAPVEPPLPMAPVPVKSESIVLTMESDTLFNFDKSVISNRGKQHLDDQVIAKMREYPQIELVRITGHADRIGSEVYNQKLSQRRASAVNDYLLEQGIVSSRTETVGRGESDPVVSCTNSTKAKRIECLRPNRRVVVEIKAMTIGQP